MNTLNDLKRFLIKFNNTFFPTSETQYQLEHQWLSRYNEGTLFLHAVKARELKRIIYSIHEEYKCGDRLSIREVERRVHNALFTANRAASSTDCEDRVSKALTELRSVLTRQPQLFTVWQPVRGIDTEDLPCYFADIRICIFDDDVLHAFQGLALSLEKLKKYARAAPNWKEPLLEIDVYAVDLDAAEQLAKRRAKELVDVLNCFAGLLPSNHGGVVYLAGSLEGDTVMIPTVARHEKQARLNLVNVGPPRSFSFEELRNIPTNEELGSAIARAEDLLRATANHRTSCEDAAVTAMAWAGRAAIANSPEETLLLYNIALESLMLRNDGSTSKKADLATRTASLLAGNSEASEIVEHVRCSYKLRSEIVHSGNRQVTDFQVHASRLLGKGAIIRTLNRNATID